MAITVDWPNRVINIPKSDMPLIQLTPIEIRELDINAFHLSLKDLEDEEDGMIFPDTHSHTPPVPLAAFDIPRVVQIINDYTVTFEDGQYVVAVTGGNHNLGARRNPNQVSLSENLSAGLVQSRDIEHASFNGGVTIDVVNGVAGTTFPIGTGRAPVNNLTDAALIASVRGLPNFYLLSDITISSGTWHARNFIASVNDVTVTLGSSASLHHSFFMNATLTGSNASPSLTLERCRVVDFSFAGEYMYMCTLRGTISLTGSGPMTFAQCIDDDPTTAEVIIDFASYTGDVSFRDWYGGLKIINKSSAGGLAMDIRGRVELEPTVTAGEITIRGIGHVTDASNGATVIVDDLLSNASISDSTHTDSRALTVGRWIALTE